MEKTKSRSHGGGIGMKNQSHGHRPVGLMEVMELIKDQIELDTFSSTDKDFAKEIALIIAEVMRLPETALIRIDGNGLHAGMVQEVYAMLEREHVEGVILAYRRAKYEIRRRKTYLRTALYNSVFETESRIENEFASEG